MEKHIKVQTDTHRQLNIRKAKTGAKTHDEVIQNLLTTTEQIYIWRNEK